MLRVAVGVRTFESYYGLGIPLSVPRRGLCVGYIRAQARAPTHRLIPGPFVSYIHHQLSVSSPRPIMSNAPSTSTSQSNFASIFNTSLESYKRKTKKDLASHPLLPSLQSCKSPVDVLTVLREQVPAFSQSQSSDDRLTKWVTPTVNVLHSFSATIGQGIGLVNTKIFLHRKFGLSCLFSGIPAGKCSLCWDRRSTFGRFPAFFCRATYFDTEGP
jgi:hypothetical protein